MNTSSLTAIKPGLPPHRLFKPIERAVIMWFLILVGMGLGIWLGNIFGMWSINREAYLHSENTLDFSVGSHDLFTFLGSDLKLEASSWNHFTLEGNGQIYAPEIQYLPEMISERMAGKNEIYVLRTDLPPGLYHVISSDYKTAGEGIKFVLTGSGNISAHGFRSSYDASFGKESSDISTVFGGILGAFFGGFLGTIISYRNIQAYQVEIE